MKRLLAAALLAPACVGTALATVNINTAQQSELQHTKGFDKHTAKAIIEYRAQHGPIETFQQLETVLGPETTEKVKSQVAFSGDPFVPPPKPVKARRKK